MYQIHRYEVVVVMGDVHVVLITLIIGDPSVILRLDTYRFKFGHKWRVTRYNINNGQNKIWSSKTWPLNWHHWCSG